MGIMMIGVKWAMYHSDFALLVRYEGAGRFRSISG